MASCPWHIVLIPGLHPCDDGSRSKINFLRKEFGDENVSQINIEASGLGANSYVWNMGRLGKILDGCVDTVMETLKEHEHACKIVISNADIGRAARGAQKDTNSDDDCEMKTRCEGGNPHAKYQVQNSASSKSNAEKKSCCDTDKKACGVADKNRDDEAGTKERSALLNVDESLPPTPCRAVVGIMQDLKNCLEKTRQAGATKVAGSVVTTQQVMQTMEEKTALQKAAAQSLPQRKQILIIGNAFGGLIAWRCIQKHGLRPDRLLLFSPSFIPWAFSSLQYPYVNPIIRGNRYLSAWPDDLMPAQRVEKHDVFSVDFPDPAQKNKETFYEELKSCMSEDNNPDNAALNAKKKTAVLLKIAQTNLQLYLKYAGETLDPKKHIKSARHVSRLQSLLLQPLATAEYFVDRKVPEGFTSKDAHVYDRIPLELLNNEKRVVIVHGSWDSFADIRGTKLFHELLGGDLCTFVPITQAEQNLDKLLNLVQDEEEGLSPESNGSYGRLLKFIIQKITSE